MRQGEVGRAGSIVELAEVFEDVDRAYSAWLDDPCRRTAETVESLAWVLSRVARDVAAREAGAEDDETVEDHGPGCDGPLNCVCSAVAL